MKLVTIQFRITAASHLHEMGQRQGEQIDRDSPQRPELMKTMLAYMIRR